MAEKSSRDPRTVASGFPEPDSVAGPTESLRRLHGEDATAVREPKFGRVTIEDAGSGDVVGMDEMVTPGGGARAAATDMATSIAMRVAEETASRVREELRSRGIPEKARIAGIGAVELSAAAALGACGVAALTASVSNLLATAMPRWAATVVTTGLLAAPAVALAVDGRRRLREGLGEVATGH